MRLEIPHREHPHLIGQRGKVVQSICKATNTLIHFPDVNNMPHGPRLNNVTITGTRADVEKARIALRVSTLHPVFGRMRLGLGQSAAQDPSASCGPFGTRKDAFRAAVAHALKNHSTQTDRIRNGTRKRKTGNFSTVAYILVVQMYFLDVAVEWRFRNQLIAVLEEALSGDSTQKVTFESRIALASLDNLNGSVADFNILDAVQNKFGTSVQRVMLESGSSLEYVVSGRDLPGVVHSVETLMVHTQSASN